HWRAGTRPKPLPTTRATLDEPIESDRGTRRFSRVYLSDPGTANGAGSAMDCPRATPTEQSGAGVLSSVALADGWVEVPEDENSVSAGTEVAVQDWEWHP
ncbi:MAG: molybdopterin molybdenumtransferase MoeA, partial [Halobacteriales archaeon]